MTYAELLRKHATDATNEGGMWFSGEYMTMLASMAESVEAENAKLRELVRRYGEYTSQDRCEGCVYKSRCNDGKIEECWQLTEIWELARELGIEVAE